MPLEATSKSGKESLTVKFAKQIALGDSYDLAYFTVQTNIAVVDPPEETVVYPPLPSQEDEHTFRVYLAGEDYPPKSGTPLNTASAACRAFLAQLRGIIECTEKILEQVNSR